MPRLSAATKARRAATGDDPPPFQPVQLASLVDSAPSGDRWLHEMKYDGYRVLLAVGGGEAVARACLSAATTACAASLNG